MVPFAWQSNKTVLFYFTQKSVSTFLFGVGEQTQQQGQTQESIYTPVTCPLPNLVGQEKLPHIPPEASYSQHSGTACPGKGLIRSHCESRLCGHSGQYQVEAAVQCSCGYQRMLSSTGQLLFTSMTSRAQRPEDLKGLGQGERLQARQEWED